MNKNLRVLSIEDSERDASLLRRHLVKAGYEVIFNRVETADEMRIALETQDWDVILADYKLPQFSALEALKLLKETGIDTPFIIISGSIGEESAVKAMIAGTSDYMMKDNLSRLVPAIERELQEAENRRARRFAEAALRESEETYRLLFESNPMPMWVYDIETLAFLAVNQAAISHYGYSREEFLSMTIKDIRPQETMKAFFENLASAKNYVQKSAGWKHLKKDGSVIDVEITSHSLIFAGRQARIVLANDITDRIKAEENLKRAEQKYRSIFENAVEGIFQSSPEGQFIAVNPAMVKMLGYESAEELIAERADISTQHYVDPNRRAELQQILTKQGLVVSFECEVYRKDKSKIWITENVRAVYDENNSLIYYEGSIENITERKSLEDQLRQSQKLEAIGQLAGGVAHDFNNLLTAITGYSILTLENMSEDNPLYRYVNEVKKAADRAASLTRQLLAFSRKQIMQPKVLNLNSIVSDMDKMLRRLIGENIEFRCVLKEGLGLVKADPGQIEQVIMNLVVNARDSMENGGRLIIETDNVYLNDEYASQHIGVIAGHHVMLAVTDTGTGMDEEVQLRVFEPFFTTKERGKGTGLGLSTVYGIVKQSGGNVWVYSEVDKGTTFKVYLPRLAEEDGVTQENEEPKKIPRGTETILLIEDDEAVRNLAHSALEMYGYNVLVAANGKAAITLCRRYLDPIHLVLTDVVMPEMGGPQVAKRLKLMRPNIRVLYMSGYTEDTIVHQGVLYEGIDYIQKPFLPTTLAIKIREILDKPIRRP